MHKVWLWIMAVLLAACTGNRRVSGYSGEGDTLELAYASYLSIVKYDGFTKVAVRNPWDTAKVLHTYLLTDKYRPVPETLPEGTVVRVPLERMLVYSAVHCSLFDELHALDAVKGVCDLSYICMDKVQERVRDGRIVDAGSSLGPDIERVIGMRPDAVLLSPFENGSYGKIEKLDIPLIECADYMETSALGRAEWIRFYGLLAGRANEADSLFAQVERAYRSLQESVRDVKRKPTVLAELKQGAAWYVPGGKSTMGQMYADAGACYLFADIGQGGSVPLSFETVFDRAQHADYWLIKYNQRMDKTYRELAQDYLPYTGFDAFRRRQVYGCNTGKLPYYEESPFHPEYLLKDLVAVFHPDLLPDYIPRYFTPLSE